MYRLSKNNKEKQWERTRQKGKRKEKNVKKGGKGNKNVPKRMEKKQKNEKKKTSWTKEITPITCVFLVPNFIVVCDWVC